MATPKTFTKQQIVATPEQDALQILDIKGDVLGWIDGTGTGQGNLASGNGVPGGSNTQVQFNDSGSFGGSANLTYDKTNVVLSAGASPNSVQAGHTPTALNTTDFLEIHGNTTQVLNSNYRIGGLSIYGHSANSSPIFTFGRSNGTQASPAAIVNGDNFARFNFIGYNGSGYVAGSTIFLNASENWNSTSCGTNIIFNNTKNTTLTSQQMLALINDGSIVQSAPSSAPTDGNLTNSSISMYVDEIGNNLKIRVKYSNGTLKTATIALV